MAKIDLEKVLIALLDSPFNKQFDDKVKDALKEQGLEYKDGKIVQKPKFNVGDWVVYMGTIAKILDLQKHCYVGKDINDKDFVVLYCNACEMKKWTIQDAKDGDVLYSLDSKQSFIFKHRKPNEQAEVYCGINIYGKFFVGNTKDCIITTDKYIPATNAQRDILFQKMKEAGYEWDADKKKLNKIEEGKASFANRQLYNRAILTILSNYAEKYPDTRFGQMLYNLGVKSYFDEESRETYWNLNETINNLL